ncbi:MAG: YbeD family protein [Candidatus Xenobium sp.]|jgi:putative lipoic acid-binding regulatory protein|nr:DUF493 domain-containing protein [Burkholderiales bacterium]
MPPSKQPPPEPAQESPLVFPCDFEIKVFGKTEEDFPQHVAEIVRRYAPGLEPERIRVRPSREGRYISVVMTVNATSKEQLEAIYHDLQKDARVLATL